MICFKYELLSEDDKRFYQRNLTKQGNYTLQQTVAKAGVKNMAEFHNAGYKVYTVEKLLMIYLKEKGYVTEKIF